LKQAEASAARLAMAVQQTDEAILITDASATILDVNPAFLRTSGYTREEVVGQNPRLLKSGNHDSSFYQQMWSTLGSGQVWRGRLTNKRKDGTLYEEDATISPMVDAAGKIVSFVGVKRDVTEKERMAAQMRRIQRLESVGSLAAGIAHDLNNALTPVLIVGELLRMEFPDRASADLDVIQAGARRGADLVKHLMNFARGAEGERLPVQLKPLCTELRQIFQSTFPKNIELQLDCPKDLPDILGDATQLHQVFLNLMVNARDAMPDGGKISITARPTDLGDPEVSFLPLQPGRYVLVRVGDTGSGIPPEALDRIFDPFFTTKGPDAGTGLGLSTSLGIVKGHGGYIRAYSIPGHGSTLSVYLPAHDADIGDTASRRGSTPAFRGQGETILVVDDEPAVRDILRRLLTKLNFKVVTAGEATSALKEVSELGTELAAVITDLHMPQLSGLSFVRVLRGRWPTTGVIVVSGLMTPQERDEFAKLGVHAVLDKPFMESDLVKALRTIFVG
jgi:PAS domain S-box-containing protein